jgi:hypothetical protein
MEFRDATEQLICARFTVMKVAAYDALPIQLNGDAGWPALVM